MKNTPRRLLLIAIAAFALPFSWANGQVFLQFNNSANNVVGGSLQTINIAAGDSFTLSLQINASVPTSSLDYWLSQFSGPSANVFSITGRDYTGSSYPDPSATDGDVTSASDNQSNSAFFGPPDGIADNVLGPRNAFDLGSSTSSGDDVGPGTNLVATYTISVSAGAAAGIYELRSFDYAGFGWSSSTAFDQTFDNHAAINISVVPEPSSLALLALAGLGAFGFKRLRRKAA